MNEYDQAARYAARRIDYAGFLYWVLGAVFLSCWRWASWLDSQSIPFPGEADRRLDTVASFTREKGDGPPLAVAIEFMSRTRSEILDRLAEYKYLIRRQIPFQTAPLIRYDAIGIVVNLTGTMEESGCVMAPPNADGLGSWNKEGIRNLSTMLAKEVLAQVAARELSIAVLAWVPLMEGGDDPDNLKEWLRLASGERNDQRRADIGGIARVFAELADRSEPWEPVLRNWNMERSAFLKEREVQGELRARRADVLRLVELRAKQVVPLELTQVVQKQTDLGVLQEWFDQIALISTIEEARTILEQTNSTT